MTPDQENFDQLRRLLGLKRHEQPPPGYFHSFSQQVILRIKDGETGEPASLFERWFGDSPLLSRIFGSFEARPALGGAVGVAICSLMVAGILYSQPETSPMVVTTAPMGLMHRSSPPVVLAYPQQATFAELSGTNGSFARHLRSSVFDQVRRPATQLVVDSLGATY